MKIKKQNSGFTLIEIIFVIAIIGVTLTLGMSYMSKLAERTKEKTAALQIQQIIQAAMTYYVENNNWPDNGQTGPANANEDFNKNYIPSIERLATNPWGSSNYIWSHTTSGGKLFTVFTTVPNANIGARIAALLPNATSDAGSAGSAKVYAQATIPGQVQQLLRGYIIKTGTVGPYSVDDNETREFLETVITQDQTTNCLDQNGLVVVTPYIASLKIHSYVGLFDFNTYSAVNPVGGLCSTLRAGESASNYCVLSTLQGSVRGLGSAVKFRPQEVRIGYTVLCMPSS